MVKKVASQYTRLNKNPQLSFAERLPNAAVSNDVECDFSDVFGPVQAQTVPDIELGLPVSTRNIFYDDPHPRILYNRGHSLVGPSSCVSHSLKLSKLKLHGADHIPQVLECGDVETVKKEHSSDDKPLGADGLKFPSVGVEDFEVLKVVGKGSFGKVYQVRKKGTSEIYAMKVMRKDRIFEKNCAAYMKAEKEILTKIDHPFIVQLKYSFQTKYRLYLVLDFVNGGHLFFQLYRQGFFREDLARIYAAEIVSAVSHLHGKGIMHRDLKPENILMDTDGHVMLTDFGLAKEFDKNTRSNSFCGTVEYMSPEIITGKGHNKATDWWSVGILLYEMLSGKPPFAGSREKIQQKIVYENVKLPGYLTSEAHSLLKGLLQKDPTKRLGSGATGDEEIRRHKWFKPINWKKLDAREIQPSFLPQVDGKLCIANFEKCWTDMPVVDSPAASPKMSDVNPFADFTYVRPPATSPKTSNVNRSVNRTYVRPPFTFLQSIIPF